MDTQPNSRLSPSPTTRGEYTVGELIGAAWKQFVRNINDIVLISIVVGIPISILISLLPLEQLTEKIVTRQFIPQLSLDYTRMIVYSLLVGFISS
ncbi:MAG TPA: hypothetical protein PKL83_04910, partial [bacterium]|nr:hypothetical protein [bacterium]